MIIPTIFVLSPSSEMEFARQGAEVVLLSEHEAGLEAVAQSIRESGAQVQTYVVDLSKPEQVAGIIGRIEAEAGPLDILVNNAGIGLGATILETRPEQMRLLFEVNFFALAELCRQALAAMAPRKHGHIINISSAAALFGSAGVSTYSATKGAVHAFTQALRTEASLLGVSVSEVMPISVRTKFFDNVAGEKYRPNGVVITPEQVAQSIVKCAAASKPPAEVQPYAPIRAVFVLTALLPTLMSRLATRHYSKTLQPTEQEKP